MEHAADILVVDDDPDFFALIETVASSLQLTAAWAARGDDALEHVETREYGLIVLDMCMPGFDGFQVLSALAERRCKASLLLVSGMSRSVLRTAQRFGREAGLEVVRLLHKPVPLDELESALVAGSESRPSAGSVRRALEDGEIAAHYQPRIDLHTGRLYGVELLSRWQHPTRGLLPPAAFLPFLDDTAGRRALLSVSLRDGLADLRTWIDAGLDLVLSVNVGADLLSPELPDWIAMHAESAGIEPERLTLEVTEQSAMSEPARACEILSRCRIKGFSVSLDDFGVGYSSLVWLHRFPFSELKIDKSFVIEFADDPEARVITRATIDLAHALSLTVCGEGIEDEATCAALVELGCDRAQGFWIARPMPAGELAGWSAGWQRRAAERPWRSGAT